jgi:hypothetical protein
VWVCAIEVVARENPRIRRTHRDAQEFAHAGVIRGAGDGHLDRADGEGIEHVGGRPDQGPPSLERTELVNEPPHGTKCRLAVRTSLVQVMSAPS